jgi:nuclear pore complex protein Nup98-Nup96
MHKDMMLAQFNHSTIESDGTRVPSVTICPSLDFKVFTNVTHKNKHFSAHERSIWELAEALWDDIPPPRNWNFLKHHTKNLIGDLMRKSRISQWLCDAVADNVADDVGNLCKLLDENKAESASIQFQIIFAWMSGCNTTEACKAAIKYRNLHLSTLISQTGGKEYIGACTGAGDLAFREDLEEQLEKWMESGLKPTETTSHNSLPYDFWKIVQVLAGRIFVSGPVGKHQVEVNVFEGLDWKRCFGLCLWYGHDKVSSLSKAIQSYSGLCEGSEEMIAKPVAWYVRDSAYKDSPLDMAYQLLCVYCKTGQTLETALSPLMLTQNSLDYRVSWLLGILLGGLGKNVTDFKDTHTHVSDHEMQDDGCSVSYTRDRLCHKFAFQLESLGLWEWAVFVLLHLSAPEE